MSLPSSAVAGKRKKRCFVALNLYRVCDYLIKSQTLWLCYVILSIIASGYGSESPDRDCCESVFRDGKKTQKTFLSNTQNGIDAINQHTHSPSNWYYEDLPEEPMFKISTTTTTPTTTSNTKVSISSTTTATKKKEVRITTVTKITSLATTGTV